MRSATIFLLLLCAEDASSQHGLTHCVDFRGAPVVSLVNPGLPDVAMATYTPTGTPVVIFNPGAIRWVSEPTRRFFYAHECAHHALAHSVRGIPFTQEQEADCWAVRKLISSDDFGEDDLALVEQDVARFGAGDWTHLPGPVRAINLRACLQDRDRGDRTEHRSSRDAWDVCYDKCEAVQGRCVDRCPDGDAWDACYDRCERRFDSCTNRCD